MKAAKLEQTSDGSLVNEEGKVIVFSPARFVRDIGLGECCFICGATPGTKPFNAEHVIPNWVLSAHSLHTKRITLPNETDFIYGKYTIPCCEECNSLMSKELETPISQLVHGGYKAVSNYIRANGPTLLFKWLALIFLKTHLKDKGLREHRDTRKGNDSNLSDRYSWDELHHVHCVARSFYTEAHLDPSVLGSLLILRAGTDDLSDGFDFGDMHIARTMMLQVKAVVFVVVLNDSGIVGKAIGAFLPRIGGPLVPLQLREVMARVAYANLSIKTRPVFQSVLSSDGEYVISADLPKKNEMQSVDAQMFGRVFYACAKNVIPEAQRAELTRKILSGKWTSIIDPTGEFINHYKGEAGGPTKST